MTHNNMFGRSGKFYAGSRREGDSYSQHWLALLFYVGCAGDRNSLRGCVITFRIPLPIYSTFTEFDNETTYKGWRCPYVYIGFRVAAGAKTPTLRRGFGLTDIFRSKKEVVETREQREYELSKCLQPINKSCSSRKT